MNVFAKFDEIPSMTLQDIKETKRYGHTFVRSFVRTDNVKTVYPPTNTVCGGYKELLTLLQEIQGLVLCRHGEDALHPGINNHLRNVARKPVFRVF